MLKLHLIVFEGFSFLYKYLTQKSLLGPIMTIYIERQYGSFLTIEPNQPAQSTIILQAGDRAPVHAIV